METTLPSEIFNATRNTTLLDPPYKSALKIVYKKMIPTLLVTIMLAMGCGVEVLLIIKYLKRPVGIIIGATSQFILLPAISFGLAHAFMLDKYTALGILIVSCCPGGVVSNIFTYWSNGDVTLSIVMTTISTLLAMGMMPLNHFIYSRSSTDQKAVIPYMTIAIALAMLLVPVTIGVIIRRKCKRLANIILKVGSISGFLLIIAALIMQRILFPKSMDPRWRPWICALVHPFVGFAGYTLAIITRQTVAISRTIAYETGNQNAGLAIALISLSYDAETTGRLSVYPLIFAIFMICDHLVLVASFQIYFKCKSRKLKEQSIHKEENYAMLDHFKLADTPMKTDKQFFKV